MSLAEKGQTNKATEVPFVWAMKVIQKKPNRWKRENNWMAELHQECIFQLAEVEKGTVIELLKAENIHKHISPSHLFTVI